MGTFIQTLSSRFSMLCQVVAVFFLFKTEDNCKAVLRSFVLEQI